MGNDPGVGLSTENEFLEIGPGRLFAQSSETDAYDPFVDYSEFEEATQEEADINFFRNGRFFTLGFNFGIRKLTEGMGDVFSDSAIYGVFLSYFFDLRFALQLTFQTGAHDLFFKHGNTTVRGNASITNVTLGLKYYFNTQNVTRGLAQLNPYVVGSFAQVTRTATRDGEAAFAKEGAMGFEFGGGIEMPLMRNKMYFGGQLTYQLVNFKDENTEIVLSGNQRTGKYLTGDIVTLIAILGVNF